MLPRNPIIQTLPELLQQYRILTADRLGFDEHLCLVHTFHSVAIDGCSLNLIEMDVLLAEGLTAGGKPLTDHLMVIDQARAFDEVLAMARQRKPLNRVGLQQFAATVMQRTRQAIRTLTTSIDTSRGDLRTVEILPDNRTAIDIG